MKTNTRILAMVARTSALIAIIGVVAFSAIEARGQYRPFTVQPPVRIFPWGNTNIVMQFAVTNTTDMAVAVYGESSPGVQNNMYSGSGGLPNDYLFASKEQIDQAFQQILVFAATMAITNTTLPVNKNLPLLVSGFTINWYYPPNTGSQSFYINDAPFQLIYTNGNWALPDLSGIKLILKPALEFYVPGLTWARIEAYKVTNVVVPFLVVDSRDSSSFSTTNRVDLVNQVITLNTIYLESGSSGPYRLKISTLAKHGFVIADGNGMQVAEIPLMLSISLTDGFAKVTVTGGDPGRVFVVQESADLKTWSQVAGPYTVGTNINWSVTFEQAMGSGVPSSHTGFFRTVTTNTVPTQ